MTDTRENPTLRDDMREFIRLFIAMRDKRREIDQRHGVTIMDTIMEWERKGEPAGRFLIYRGIDQIAEALGKEIKISREYSLQKYFLLDRIAYSQSAEPNSTRFLQAHEERNAEGV